MGAGVTDRRISFCATLSRPPVQCGLRAILADVAEGRWAGAVGAARAAGDAEKYARAKRSLPALIFAGVFAQRKKDALKAHSGLLCLDLDGKDNPGMAPEQMRQIVAADAHTLAAFVSPSGEGLKVLVAVAGGDPARPPRDAAEHEAAFRAAERHYRDALGLVVDPSGKDVCRLCFVSHDPQLWVAPEWPRERFAPEADAAQSLPKTQQLAPRPGKVGIEDRARKYLAKMPEAVSGQHGHDALFAAALAVRVGFDLDEQTATRLLLEGYNPRCQPPWSESEIAHKVADAGRNGANLPRGYLRDAPAKAGNRPAGAAPAPAPHPAGEGQKKPAPTSSELAAPSEGGAGGTPPAAPTSALAEPEEDYPECDDGNARRMRNRHGAILRHSDAGDWLIWTGQHWQRGAAKQVTKLWRELVAEMRAAAANGGTDKQRRWAEKCGNRAMTENMRILLETQDGIDCADRDFDPSTDFLPVLNGVLDLRTGALRPDHQPGDMNTRLVEVEYDPDAQSETWDGFLRDLCTPKDAGEPDEALMEYLQECAGYTLTPHISEQAVFVLVGGGRNGKSTFLDTLAAVFGRYAGRVATETFSLARQQSSNARELALHDQQGLRFTQGTEIPGDMRLDEALIKTFTETTLTGRALYQQSCTYYNSTHLWLYGNHRPYVHDGDLGIWRRLKLIELDSTIPEGKVDVTLPDRLRQPDAQQAILAWLVQGARKWYENGRKLAEPETVRRATRDWRASQDKIGMFIEECCDLVDADTWGPKLVDLYRAFKRWCEFCGFRPLAKPTFEADLLSWTGGAPAPPVTARADVHRNRYVYGLVLRSDWE